MIEAKSLAKAMKSAAKGGGYKIYVPEERGNLYLWTDLWCVVLEARRVPRLVLAPIVEQTGELPKIGVCGIVTAEGLQTMLKDAAREECNAWTDDGEETFAKLAPIRYRGMLIYQSEQMEVFATNGAGIGIIERSAAKSASVTDESRLFYVADGECLILHCSRPVKHLGTPSAEMPVWAALESCDLGTVE